ncbi:MAG: cytochrome c3 family protein, partial [Bacteroidales bacterium]
NCAECHTTLPGWTPATFDHTSFPLTNGHSGVDCAQCHDPNDYANISPDCYACHQADYDNTTNPSHVAASISIDCMECHTTNPGWKPADFPIHDAQFFPIYSGAHRGEWSSCTQCHEDLNNYASFTCLTCHEHSQSTMDDKHSGESGYTYNSMACLECHPRGSGD